VNDRMEFHQCQANAPGLNQKVDFILAFYMIHETPDAKGCLREMRKLLKPGGKMLVVEPKMHVNQELFETMQGEAKDVGFKILEIPKGKGGRSVLFSA